MSNGMQGWRIEVREELRHCDRGARWTPDATDPTAGNLRVHLFALTPQRLMGEGRAHDYVHAAAWVLRDTIYVSRPVTDAEADTLRELLDAEMRRERDKLNVRVEVEDVALEPPTSDGCHPRVSDGTVSSEWCAPIHCEPPASRVPQVGDEIEVRWSSTEWVRVCVAEVGRGWIAVNDRSLKGTWYDGEWRWPEAKL